MQAGARPPYLSGDQRQSDQAARVVGAVNVLRDAHTPEDYGAIGLGVSSRDAANGLGFDAADGGDALGSERPHTLSQLREALGEGLDILLVGEPFLDDR